MKGSDMRLSARNQLEARVGDEITVIIKATEVMLAKD